VAAWQVHSTAWELYTQLNDGIVAQRNRGLAKMHILAIANSFTSEDPLRKSFLAAPVVRRVLDKAPTPVRFRD
jgi:hypothetical protein